MKMHKPEIKSVQSQAKSINEKTEQRSVVFLTFQEFNIFKLYLD